MLTSVLVLVVNHKSKVQVTLVGGGGAGRESLCLVTVTSQGMATKYEPKPT